MSRLPTTKWPARGRSTDAPGGACWTGACCLPVRPSLRAVCRCINASSSVLSGSSPRGSAQHEVCGPDPQRRSHGCRPSATEHRAQHKLKLDRGCLGEPLLRSVQYRHACDILDLLLLLLPAAASRHRCQLACRHFHTPAPRCPAATPCAVGLGSAPLVLAPRCLASTRQHLGALYPPWRAGVWQLKQRAGGRCNFQGANGSCRQCTCQRLWCRKAGMGVLRLMQPQVRCC